MKSNNKNLIIVIIISVTLVAIVVFGSIYFMSSNLCTNNIIQEYPSPNGKYKIVLFERDCGATTDFSSQVSLLKTNDNLKNEGGNLFVCDCDHGKAPRAKWGGPEIRIHWINQDTLNISYHKNVRIFLKQFKLKKIFIKYDLFQ